MLLGSYGLGRALPVLVAGFLAPRKRLSELLPSPIFRQSVLQQLNAVALALTGAYLLASGA